MCMELYVFAVAVVEAGGCVGVGALAIVIDECGVGAISAFRLGTLFVVAVCTVAIFSILDSICSNGVVARALGVKSNVAILFAVFVSHIPSVTTDITIVNTDKIVHHPVFVVAVSV